MDGRHRQRLPQLEAARGFAALYVVAYHSGIFHGTRLRVLVSFGQEAVMLFFLISGFVVYYSTFYRTRRPSLWGYLYRRARRIWPLFLVSLVISYLVLALERHSAHVLGWRLLAGNLFMLQDNASLKPGVWFDTFGNSALWSLSYEWWFYMLFFPLAVWLMPFPRMQLWSAFALSVAGCVAYQIAPNQPCLILGYFFLWWCGAECGKEYVEHGRITLYRQRAALLSLAALTCLWSIPVIVAILHGVHARWGLYPVLPARHLLSALVLLAAGITWAQSGCPGFRYTFRPVAVLAPISYALYLVHLPVLSVLQQLSSGVEVLRLGLALLVLLPLCYLLEVKLQRAVEGTLDRMVERVRAVLDRSSREAIFVADRA